MQVAKVIIRDAGVDTRQFGGKEFHSQTGILSTGPDESLTIEISLPRGQKPYEVGTYMIDGRSFDRDQYGRPCFGKRGLYLVPAPKGAA